MKRFRYIRSIELEVGHVLVLNAVGAADDRRAVTRVERYGQGHRAAVRVYVAGESRTYATWDTVPIEVDEAG